MHVHMQISQVLGQTNGPHDRQRRVDHELRRQRDIHLLKPLMEPNRSANEQKQEDLHKVLSVWIEKHEGRCWKCSSLVHFDERPVMRFVNSYNGEDLISA